VEGDAMKVVQKLGPADHGRELDYDEFMAAEYQAGHQYEIIDGRLYVSPQPNPPQDKTDIWLLWKLLVYSKQQPNIVNHVTNRGRIFVPDRPRITVPEPDLAAYRDYPHHLPVAEIRWEELQPVLVGEVVTKDNPDKDLVRNRELYLLVPSIKEYWIFDLREDADRPTLLVLRRHGAKWREINVPFGETYTTKLLPGFELLVDPRN
jgi:Uma2 family endonuclease